MANLQKGKKDHLTWFQVSSQANLKLLNTGLGPGLSPPRRPIFVVERLGRRRKKSPGGPSTPARLLRYGVFLHDVTAAILMSQSNETSAMLVFQTNPVGVDLFSYSNAFFCSNKSG